MSEVDLHGSPNQEGYTEVVRKIVRNQIREIKLHKSRTFTCPCGRTIILELAYRCFKCGIWWCPKCANLHFGGRMI